MNKIFKYGLLLLGASLLAACQPEVLRPDQSRLPVASELTADIQVDQTTNIVTFSILDKGSTASERVYLLLSLVRQTRQIQLA